MIIEMVLFRLQSIAQPEQLLAAVDETTAFLQKQEGFIRRVVSKTEQGEWADMVHWTTMEAASRAAALFQSAPEARHFLTLLDLEQIQIFHFQIVVEQQ